MDKTILEKYYRALNAVLDLEGYESDAIQPIVTHLRNRIASIQTDLDDLDFEIERIEPIFTKG